MSLEKLLTTIFVSLLLSGNVFAEGSKFDRFATDAETAAQVRDDVGLTPSNISSIMAAPGPIGETAPNTVKSKFVELAFAADAVTLTSGNCSDTLITNRGWDGADDQTFTFPDADTDVGEGLKIRFRAVVASGGVADTYFDPEGSTTKIYLDGTAMTDGHMVWTEQVAIGESMACETFTIDGTTYDWACDRINGNWLDKGS